MTRRTELRSHPRSEGTTGRLQALTDGFYAVAMTLLVLNLPLDLTKSPLPSTATVLSHALPHLLLYFDSILVLGVLWFGNRNAFEYVERTDHPHTWLSLGVLAFVALVPWTTGLAASRLHDPLAITVYTVNLVFATAFDAATWLYATGRGHLTARMSPEFTRTSRRLTAVPVTGMALATGLAWASTWAGLATVVALPLLAISGLTYRVQHRLSTAMHQPE
jgi:uncharacterized membrane protein